MTNYTQVNIYRKQMQELGLNTKQYAELINMPYEVVKDIIYDKEGEYSMDIKNILRRNMMEKHQEIENDFDNAKFKAMEIKRDDDSKILEWYEKEYNVDLLKNELKIESIIEFEREYCLITNGVKASHWTYMILCSKREYKRHDIRADKKLEFIKQLYDIIVNKNTELYLNRKLTTKKTEVNKKINYRKWYKDFDIKQFKKEQGLDNTILAKELNLGPCTISHLVSKKEYSNNTLAKLYNYVQKVQKDTIVLDKSKAFDISNLPTYETIDETINPIEELADDVVEKVNKHLQTLAEMQEEDDNNTASKIGNVEDLSKSYEKVLEDYTQRQSANIILRKILISRLTEEEKELIRIFGGRLD